MAAGVNYYEHHLGDYLRDTAHLSMLEDAAYRRLLDAYYIREAPLPTDFRECCKLARAASKAEREAVAYVLREFFDESADGYRQSRADAEIARFQDKQRKASASAQARWKKSERNANAYGTGMRTHMRTHCEWNALQTPVTSNQTQEQEQKQRGAKTPELALPDWLPESAWRDWHTFRNTRKGWTIKARELSLATLRRLHAEGNDPVTVIHRSIE